MPTSFFFRILGALTLATVLCGAQSRPTLEEGLRLKREQKLPEAAAIFRSLVQSEPANVDAMVQLATVEGWQRHYEESIRWWERAWALRPDDADIGIGLARVRYWKGENANAVATMERVLAAHPRYVDALVLMGDIQMAGGRPDEAQKFYQRAQELDPSTPGLAKKLRDASAPLRWRFDTGFSGDNYDRNRGPREYFQFTQLGYRLHRRATVWLRQEHYSYFQQLDNGFGFGATVLPTARLAVTAELSFVPRPDFQPRRKVYLGADFAVHPKVTLSANYRRWTYPLGVVNMYAPGLRWQPRAWLGASLRYTVSRNIDRSITTAWQTQFDFQVHEQVMVYGGYARGEENIPPQARASFRAYSTGTVWNPHRRFGLRLDYSYEHRPVFWNRHSLAPGVRLSF